MASKYSNFFLLFKIVFIIYISLYNFYKKEHFGILIGIVFNLHINLWKINILTILVISIYGYDITPICLDFINFSINFCNFQKILQLFLKIISRNFMYGYKISCMEFHVWSYCKWHYLKKFYFYLCIGTIWKTFDFCILTFIIQTC